MNRFAGTGEKRSSSSALAKPKDAIDVVTCLACNGAQRWLAWSLQRFVPPPTRLAQIHW
jgi:hypothetical protein